MWKTIPDYPDYEVSKCGQVKSNRRKKPRILKPVMNKGYPFVLLYNSQGRKLVPVHRIVWTTYVGPIPDGMCVLHGTGGIRSCASLEYLRLGTYGENQADRVKDGTDLKGENHPHTVLTDVQVRYIKQRLIDGMSNISLARLFGVNRQMIFSIKKGRTWGHIKV